MTFVKGRIELKIRPFDVATAGEVDANTNTCWADLSLDVDTKPVIAEMFDKIRHNRFAEGPAIVEAIIIAKQGKPYDQQSSVMMESMPASFQDFAKSVRERLDGAVARLVGLIRWRAALYGPAKSIIFKGPLEWSDDGATWQLMPFVVSSSLEAQVGLGYNEARHNDLQAMYDANLEEPVYRELFREAVHLQEVTPRSAIVLAVAAVEIAIKRTITELDPSSKSELEREDAPPALYLLRERLPTLTTRNTVCGLVLPPPNRILTVFQKAVFARNQLVHRGTEPLSRDSLIEKINAMRDILLLLDYYQGYDWAYEQMSQATVDELGPRLPIAPERK